MRIRVINLDRSTDRLANFMALNDHLTNVSRFPAVDGRKVDLQSLTTRGLVAENITSTYSIGDIGCALSHIALWNECIGSQEILTIAEDDTIFHKEFENHAKHLINDLPNGWDLITWGWNFNDFICFEFLPGISHCLSQFEHDRLNGNIDLFSTKVITPCSFKLLWAFGTPCYTISPKGAECLRKRVLPLRPMTIPSPDRLRSRDHERFFEAAGIDITLNSVYKELEAFICFPPIVVSKNEVITSTIQLMELAAAGSRASNVVAKEKQELTQELEGCNNRLTGDPDDLRALDERGLVLFKLERYPEALVNYDRILALIPDAVECLFNRACVLRKMNRFEEAVFTCDRALAIRPNFLPALKERGLLLQYLGRFEEALITYDKALAFVPSDAISAYNRAMVLHKLNRLEEAVKSYEQALALQPDLLDVFRRNGMFPIQPWKVGEP